jgi:hypothetical protein
VTAALELFDLVSEAFDLRGDPRQRAILLRIEDFAYRLRLTRRRHIHIVFDKRGEVAEYELLDRLGHVLGRTDPERQAA